MRLAIIDLGTNSVRFDVVELRNDGDEAVRLYREKLMIRLGEGVFLKRRLDPKVVETCVLAFQSFRRTMDDFRVNRVVAFGTAALRVARDGDRFIKLLKSRSGISLKVISGDEEARLIARGILKNEANLRGRFALIDIGGGSTEISICQGREVLHSASFPLGTASLQQVFLKTIPPDLESGSIENLRRHIRSMLVYKFVSEEWPSVKRVLGSSGTVRAVARLNRRHFGADIVRKRELGELVEKMKSRSRDELARIPGMESRRLDMILAGAILLQEAMQALNAEKVEPTEYSLRDGILDQELEILRVHKTKIQYDPIKEIYRAALSLGCRNLELRHTQQISEDLFDRLGRLHGLKGDWKNYLIAAAILQGVGRAISPVREAGHSAYIAKHVDVSGLEEWESQFIAELCVHHYESRVIKKELPFKKDKKRQRAFLKLLALMRVAVALSFQRSKPLHILGVKVDDRVVRVRISSRDHADLQILRADHRKGLFEDVFNRSLQFEQV